MKSFRENSDGEENQKATREHEAYIKQLQLPEHYYERMRLEQSETCKHEYQEDSTVCVKCGS
jgi:hypothetical protein